MKFPGNFNWPRVLPFLAWLPRVNGRTVPKDLTAAVTNAAIILPEGVAYAAIAGLPPVYGFYAALVTPIIAALFGSSWQLITGPSVAISALVYGALAGNYEPGSPMFIQAALTMTFFAGLFQIAFALARMGQLVNFMSKSVMVGFTAGTGILIAISQLEHLMGVEVPESARGIAGFWTYALEHINYYTTLVGVATLVIALLLQRYTPRAPSYLLALGLGSLLGVVLGSEERGIALVGSLPSIVPVFTEPDLDLKSIRELIPSAIAIGVVGLLQTISVARSVAVKTGQMINTDQEFLGQGLGNTVGSLFSAYAGSGSFTRTWVNYESGARTPLASILTAVILLLILLLVAPWFAYMAVPAVAGIILLVAARLVDVKEFIHLMRTSKSETTITLTTFLSTILVGLEFAIAAGVVLSLLFFLRGTTKPYTAVVAPDPNTPRHIFREAVANDLQECPQVLFVRLGAPIYFGSIIYLRQRLREFEADRPGRRHVVLIIIANDIDLPGCEMLAEEAKRIKREGGEVSLVVRNARVLHKFRRFHVFASVGEENMYFSKGDLVSGLVERLDKEICARCTTRIFRECPERPGSRL
ncbi:MAG: SulP family inorganic anion transporter [Pseudomonadota bacterium]